MRTRLYGCIEEYGLLTGDRQALVYEHNRKIINALPEDDDWPPLSRKMFAITYSELTDPGPYYAYGGRIIHFGANFKSIEYEWKEWKEKFELLLTQLFWYSADVHFKTEYTDIQTFKWEIDLKRWHIDHDESARIEPIKKEHWDFEGDLTWENMK